ncbi:hypothetical protein ACO0RG_001645 [Hanseniaspora osmophila]|uniref:Serine/threonine-protein kinase svkA n=1 Tax=Hanseniaspora osmophila TaxID=56408 RepID=A0A1E5RHV2_9ASCO|nr:Serine/threonine-protein kinase svkA [Hanseniaspora osmophila]
MDTDATESGFQPHKLSSNSKDYCLVSCIGRGSFGEVYKAIFKPTYVPSADGTISDDQFLAVKIIDMEESEDDIACIFTEVFFLANLKNNTNIVKYYKTFSIGSQLWIIMEYCGNGSCHGLMKKLPFDKFLNEKQISVIVKQILQGLQKLHYEQKVHRDIKLANVLISNSGAVKLTDFGVSAQIREKQQKLNTFVGSPNWMAPEVILNNFDKNYKKGYDEKIDIWSLGITVIELVEKRAPSPDKDVRKILQATIKRDPPTLNQCSRNISDSLKDFVNCCLQKDAEKRLSAEELLKHEFITKFAGCDEKGIVNDLLSSLLDHKGNNLEISANVFVDMSNNLTADSDELDKHNDTEFTFDSIDKSATGSFRQRANTFPNSAENHTPVSLQEEKPVEQSTIETSEQEKAAKLQSEPVGSYYYDKVVDVVFANVAKRCLNLDALNASQSLRALFRMTEKLQPGFSNVFVEELWLRIKSKQQE